jgi:pimeloyl-ACP methyl ester carboxylesterase
MSKQIATATSLLATWSVPYWLRRTYRALSARRRGVFRPVRFLSADGIRLAGLYGESVGAHASIVFCHGWPGDKEDMLDLAAAVRVAGFNVLAFDFRSWGESDQGPVTLGYREAEDIVGAVRFLRQRHSAAARAIGVVGISMGAAAAILAAVRTPEITAVVADSSYARLDDAVRRVCARFGWLSPLAQTSIQRMGEQVLGTPLSSIAPIAAIPRISPRPVLIIHGSVDRLTDVEDARLLYQASGNPKDLWTVDAAGHGRARRLRQVEYDRRVIEFFRQHVAGAD